MTPETVTIGHREYRAEAPTEQGIVVLYGKRGACLGFVPDPQHAGQYQLINTRNMRSVGGFWHKEGEPWHEIEPGCRKRHAIQWTEPCGCGHPFHEHSPVGCLQVVDVETDAFCACLKFWRPTH